MGGRVRQSTGAESVSVLEFDGGVVTGSLES
jgi:hypothetical protein